MVLSPQIMTQNHQSLKDICAQAAQLVGKYLQSTDGGEVRARARDELAKSMAVVAQALDKFR